MPVAPVRRRGWRRPRARSRVCPAAVVRDVLAHFRPDFGHFLSDHPIGAYDEPAAKPGRVGMLDDCCHGDGTAGSDVVGDLTELGEGDAVDLLDVHVEDAAAGQSDGERVVVADAVALEHRSAVSGDLLAELVDGALDATTRDRADGFAGGADDHRSAGRPGCGLERGHDRAERDGVACAPPGHQLVEHLTHGRPPRPVRRTSPSNVRPRSRQRKGAPPRFPAAPARSRSCRGAG